MRIGDIVAAVVVVGVVVVFGTCWVVSGPRGTMAERYPDAEPPPVLDSASRIVLAAVTRHWDRHHYPVRTIEELGPLSLPPGTRVTRVIPGDSVSHVYIEGAWRDSVLHCGVTTRVVAGRVNPDGSALPHIDANCDVVFPQTGAELDAYYRHVREKARAREAGR